jgi:pyruvate,orthophosphate dikinase
VATYPISEQQAAAEQRSGDHALESKFPRIYARLKEIAEELVYQRGFNHQDIEFTFEGPDAKSLFVLQTRDMAPVARERLQVFVPTPKLRANLLGVGIGAGGGALSGVAVHRIEETQVLRERFPGAPLIMLRPDTVPDDIAMMLKVDGVLTARGGSTSHAAIAAHRLGKPCVVGCRQLQVNERLGRSVFGNHVLRTGDWIGLDGHNGFIYVGRHDTMTVADDGKQA